MILRDSDQETILKFDDSLFSNQDPIERELARWKARSRPEALEHYLPLGWSFAAWAGETMVGYFLAQPLLFYAGLTQTLWVETLQVSSTEAAQILLDTACRLAREKHFQRVLFSELGSYANLLEALKARPLTESIFEVQTSKFVR